MEERFEGLLDLPVEIVRAARHSDVEELGQIADLAAALARVDDATLDRLHTAYERADRLAGRAAAEASPTLRGDLLVDPAEAALTTAVTVAAAAIDAALAAGDPRRALESATALADPVDRFFDDVLVMAEDRAVRANRLRLLLDVRDTLKRVADFSELQR